jgi:VanZ family protein
MLVLFFVPIPKVPFRTPRLTDKLVHAALFLGFAVLYRLDHWPRRLRVILVAAAFAGAVELIQGLTPYRSAELGDFLAGTVGAVAGVLLVEAGRAGTVNAEQ